MGRFVEICCTSLLDALEAQAGGGSRIELCRDLSVGGVTPDTEVLREVIAALRIPVNVLVRPRGGSFVFTPEEVERMLSDIEVCKAAGASGVVIGALWEDGSVDADTMRRLIAAARPMSVTFHRAFDVCADPLTAFEEVIELGCERLLTSGHEADAYTGRGLIAELVRRAQGRIIVMAGCGVRPHNIAAIETASHAPEYHSTAQGSDGRTARETVARLVSGNERETR